ANGIGIGPDLRTRSHPSIFSPLPQHPPLASRINPATGDTAASSPYGTAADRRGASLKYSVPAADTGSGEVQPSCRTFRGERSGAGRDDGLQEQTFAGAGARDDQVEQVGF